VDESEQVPGIKFLVNPFLKTPDRQHRGIKIDPYLLIRFQGCLSSMA
jgi:hypothetical protein